MPSAITFTGLGSGLDTDSIVKGLVQVERQRRIEPLERWKDGWEEKLEALREINQKLANLYGVVSSMDTESELVSKSVSISNSALLSATASASATNASYDILVNQLAKTEKEIHTNGEISSDTVINNSGGTKTFKYSYAGGSTISVNVPNGTTLSGLRDLINNDPNNPGVTASILYDGTRYHLMLTGNDTGATNTIVVDPDSTATLTGYTNGTFLESQSAQNAQIRLNGYPAASWIERSSNLITDLITGVTLNLLSTGSTTLTISNDVSSVEGKIQDFVESYNELLSTIKKYSYYDLDRKKAGILNGNYAVQIIESKLRGLLAAMPAGFSKTGDAYSSLQQIGFYTDVTAGSSTEGQLLFDASSFEGAFNADPTGVIDLLVANFKSVTTDSNIRYYSHTSNSKPGIYDVEINTNTLEGRFRPYGGDWHPWRPLEGSSGDYYLTGGSGYDEEGIALRITYG
ncbi:MAG: flagellar filament capping protein FliD, partial [Desulfatiglandales bacterium]